MKKLLPFLLFLLFPTLAQAQNPATVTGHTIFPSAGAAQNSSVCFTLLNFKPNLPRVITTGTVVQQQNWCITPSSTDGFFSTPVLRNDFISPSGTYWRVDFMWNGLQQSSANFLINHTPFNLDTEVPLNQIPIVGPKQIITQSFVCPQVSASTTWTCTHNFNDVNVNIETFDSSGKVIYPDTVTVTNTNVVTITFVVPQSGLAVVFHAGQIAIATNQPNAVVTNPTGPQTILSGQPLNIQASTIFSSAPSFNSGFTSGGATIHAILLGSGLSLNSAFTSITGGTCQEQTLTLSGTLTSGTATANPTTTIGANFSWSAWISASDTISVRVCAGSTATPTSVTWNASVIQ